MWENEYLIEYTKLFFWPASRRRKFCLFQNFPNLVFVPKTPNPSFIGFYSRLYWLYRIITLFSAPGPPGEETKLWEKNLFFFDKNLWRKEKICFSGSSCLSSGELNWNWGFSSWLESAEQWQGAQISMLKEICPKNSKIPKNQYQWQGVQMSILKEICPKNLRLEDEEKCTPLVFVQFRDHHELHCGTGAT